MPYLEDLAALVATYREEIEVDLTKARQLREQTARSMADAERQVLAFEALLAMTAPPPPASADGVPSGKLTLHAAMRRVLEDAPGYMMRAADIAMTIERRGLYRMRDGRPVEAQQIHARVGHYPDDFVREGTFIKLA